MVKTDPRETLRAHGLRCTQGRLKMLSVLRSAKRPLSHAEVVARLGPSRMNRVSVYRALEALLAAGLVHRAFVDGRTWVFEVADRCGPRQCHPHFSCRACGAVTCMTDVVLPVAEGLPEGYTLERQKVYIEGACALCNQRGQKKGA